MVLQLMTMPAQTGQVPTEGAVPAQSALAEGAVHGLEPFAGLVQALDEELSVPDSAAAGEPVVAAEAAQQAGIVPVPLPEVAPAPQQPAQDSAEQWLLSMLGQRQVSVQARDGEVEHEVEGGAAVPASEANGLVGLLARLPARPAAAVGVAGEPAPSSQKEAVTPASAERPVAAVPLAMPMEGATASATALEPAALSAAAPSGVLAGQSAEAALPSVGAAPAGQAPVLERQLRLQAPEAKWGEQMLGALRDSVELQLQQKVQSATIRLDPPELGSLEILLSHEAGRLNVQISAAQGDVARLLQQTSERLRQELVGQNFLQVSVQVSADGQSGQQQHSRSRPQLPEAAVAASVAPEEGESASQQSLGARDVLITV